MAIFYSASAACFFDPDRIRYLAVPTDLVEVTEEEHNTLISGQTGEIKIGSNGNGHPILVPRT